MLPVMHRSDVPSTLDGGNNGLTLHRKGLPNSKSLHVPDCSGRPEESGKRRERASIRSGIQNYTYETKAIPYSNTTHPSTPTLQGVPGFSS